MKRYLPEVDEIACLAHGDCEAAAPGVFRVGEIAEVVGEGEPEEVLRAARACPAGAIVVFDADTGEQVYP
jgi:ferredoxin